MRTSVAALVAALASTMLAPATAGASSTRLEESEAVERMSVGLRWGYPETIALGDEWDIAYVDAYDWSEDEENPAQAGAATGTAHCIRKVNASGTEYDRCLEAAPTDDEVSAGVIRRDGDDLVLQGTVGECAVDVRMTLDSSDESHDYGLVSTPIEQNLPARISYHSDYAERAVVAASGTACGHVLGGTDRFNGSYYYVDRYHALVTPDLP